MVNMSVPAICLVPWVDLGLEARHYFGWCRPRPHLLSSPGSPGSWRGRAAPVGAAPRTRASAASAAMSGRSVPHAHPATAEYEFANPSRLGEQRFGEGLLPEELLTPTLYHGYYVRPRAAPAGEGSRAGASELRLSEGKFQAFLDVSHFTPDEVTVRTVDNLLEVSARHPQRLDRHGFVSREFCRTYVLPADVDPWRVRAALSHDGILNLEAPRGGRHLDTEVNEVYISLLPAPPDPEEEEEGGIVEP
ncbi:heat shock protein beta-2 [Pongo pygmaeus]